jgi:outer membrane protein, heavy metal efflux system
LSHRDFGTSEEYQLRIAFVLGLTVLAVPALVLAQQNPPAQQSPPAQQNPPATAAMPPRPSPDSGPSARITLDEALRLAIQHNHALQAARTTILQSQALETTASFRPNPTVSTDYNFVPAFSPSYFSAPASQAPLPQEFDVSFAYTIEMAHKRQARLTGAKDQTAITRSQVADNERLLSFNVGQQFVAAILAQSTIDFTQQDLDSFQKTVDISETRYKAGGH